MPRFLWGLICQRVITDQDTNLPSYIDIIEEFGVPKVPYRFPPLTFVSVWRRELDDEELRLRVRVQCPSGATAFTHELDLIRMTKLRQRVNFRFGGFSSEETGDFRVTVESHGVDGWKDAASVPITVNLVAVEA